MKPYLPRLPIRATLLPVLWWRIGALIGEILGAIVGSLNREQRRTDETH